MRDFYHLHGRFYPYSRNFIAAALVAKATGEQAFKANPKGVP
jgi:hypothetical protein